jgi:hypothetical protein
MRIRCNNKSIAFSLMLAIVLVCFYGLRAANAATIQKNSITDSVDTLQFEMTYSGNIGTLHVYIDTDMNAKTGHIKKGIGADYLIEADRLYATKVNTQQWIWTALPESALTQVQTPGEGDTLNAVWTLPKAEIGLEGCEKTIRVIFETTTTGNDAMDVSAVITYKYTCSPGNVTATPSPVPTIEQATTMQIGVPAYFGPDAINCKTNCTWAQLQAGSAAVRLAVFNPNSGPGTSRDLGYVHTVQVSQTAGVNMIGYVPTNYEKRSIQQVTADIDRYFEWYKVDGIFLDEVSNTDCGKTLDYYYKLHRYIKEEKSRNTFVVLNPGTNTLSCFLTVSDILVTFEGDYTAYLNWKPAGWETETTPDRFWHIIHTTPQPNLAAVIASARTRHVGWIYITPDVMANPYDTLPAPPYWNAELSAVSSAK